jgi:DNA-binding GntR family transcriptional regulator
VDPREIGETLKRKIIWLALKPESVINISEMAETFGVSRTPIKEALIHLQADGWIVRHGTHFIVTPLSLDRIREISEIRMVLEPQACIWAMERMTPDEAAELVAIKNDMLAITEAVDNKTVVELDFRLHKMVFKAARNTQMAQLLERLLSQYLRFWLSIPRQIRPGQFFQEAVDLIAAIIARDETAVRQCVRRHIRASVSEIMGTR